MTKLVSKWNYPTTVRFGAGRIAEIADALKFAGIERPLFVTDPGLWSAKTAPPALAVLFSSVLPVIEALLSSKWTPPPVGL